MDLQLTPAQFAQQLKDQLRIEQVIGEYIPTIVRAGTGFKGLCPFHKEKTPSFHIHPDRGFYHCFGCGASGDLVKFVQEIEKVDFMIALELLARRAGMSMPEFGSSSGPRGEERDRLLEDLRRLCEWGEQFFIEQLEQHPRGALARDYLRRRGLSDEEIRRYRLGYAPDGWENLLAAAGRRGWNPETVAEAGLASRRDSGGFTDRFRDRIIFPIDDRMGQVVAFAGRIFEPREDAPKYINSADTPLFHKSLLLYGVAAAREAIKETGHAIVLEGYMDWLAMHRRGIGNVLAGMGTALTEEQARLLRRLTGNVTLLYDADTAGQKAAFRAAEILLRQGMAVRAATLPEGEDPDSYLEAKGTAALRERLDAAPLALDHFTEQIASESNLARPEGQAEAVGRLAPLLLALEDPAIREGYLRRAAARLGLRADTLEAAIARRVPRQRRAASVEAEPGAGPESAAPAESTSLTEQYLLYILFSMGDPSLAAAGIDPEWFQDRDVRQLFSRLQLAWRDVREGGDPPSDPFGLCDDKSQRERLRAILMLPMRRFAGEVTQFQDDLAAALELALLRLQRQWARRRRQELALDLQMVLHERPVGSGQLAAIERLTRDDVARYEDFLRGIQEKK